MPAPKMPTIMGSTTVTANSAAMAASTALPPAASISAPAAEPSGWLVTTMPSEAVAGRFSVSKVVPARLRHPVPVMDPPRGSLVASRSYSITMEEGQRPETQRRRLSE